MELTQYLFTDKRNIMKEYLSTLIREPAWLKILYSTIAGVTQIF